MYLANQIKTVASLWWSGTYLEHGIVQKLPYQKVSLLERCRPSIVVYKNFLESN